MGAKVKKIEEAPRDVNADITNALLEMPTYYNVRGQIFYVFPPSLGVQLLIGERMKKYKFYENTEKAGTIGLFKTFKEHKEAMVSILALCSFENRKDATKQHLLAEREKALENIDPKEGLALVTRILNYASEVQTFIKHFEIDKEQKQKKRVFELKNKDSSSITFGGKSVWGAVVDSVCERYGWTVEYALWGVSSTNLNMLTADAVTSVFLTDKERKKLHLPANGKVIKADDPQNEALVEAFIKKIKI